jgi:hypothetical protein
LHAKQPFSVVRIGDGEANLLTYDLYPNTPVLDRTSARAIIAMQQDTFAANEDWLVRLREQLLESIHSADIIGVRGVDRWSQMIAANQMTKDQIVNGLHKNPRGFSGIFRSEYYMLSLAKQSLLAGKTVTSAHLYFGLLKNIRRLLEAVDKVILITDRITLAALLAPAAPQAKIITIPVGVAAEDGHQTKTQRIPPLQDPTFLETTRHLLDQLGPELKGALCLIGAGPWAELYCTHAKRLGAVAIDLGSGMDLLCGVTTRPVHRIVQQLIPNWTNLI